jgi:hypothetical protein
MSPIAQIEGTTVLFLIGLALTCGFLLFRTHRQLNTRPKTKPSPPATWSKPQPPPAATAHHLGAPAEVRRWEAELHELTRELRGQLDTKIALVERLIRDAGQQAARLDAAIERATILRADLAAPPTSGPPPAHFNAAPTSTARVSAHASTSSGRPSSEPAQAARPPRPVSSAARRHAEIYSLADSGLASAAIAARIGSPIGEIDLILGLRGKA